MAIKRQVLNEARRYFCVFEEPLSCALRLLSDDEPCEVFVDSCVEEPCVPFFLAGGSPASRELLLDPRFAALVCRSASVIVVR